MRRSTLLSPTLHGRHSSSLSLGRSTSTSVAVAAAATTLPARTFTPPPSKTIEQYRTGADTQWADIFDGPMRPEIFVSPSGHTPPGTGTSSTPSPPIIQKENTDPKGKSVLKELPVPVMFDGPANPRYILPCTYAQLTQIAGTKNRKGGAATKSREKRSRSPLRSSLPAPTVYDGPAFEWETA